MQRTSHVRPELFSTLRAHYALVRERSRAIGPAGGVRRTRAICSVAKAFTDNFEATVGVSHGSRQRGNARRGGGG